MTQCDLILEINTWLPLTLLLCFDLGKVIYLFQLYHLLHRATLRIK